MAKLSEDGKIVTVEAGDTLSEISEKYLGSGKPATYKKLAAWNDIDDPNFTIYVGQKLKLYDPGSSSSTASTNKVTLANFGLQALSDKTLFVTWKWSKHKTTESYKVWWRYTKGDGNWFGSPTNISVDHDCEAASRISTFDIPEGAYKISVKVLPIAETSTESKSGVSKAKWTANWSTEKQYTNKTPVGTPSIPTVELDELKLTATLDNLNIPGVTHIEFKLIKDDTAVIRTTKVAVKYVVSGGAGRASCTWDVQAGFEYKVCCRAYSNNMSGYYSDWSDFSESKKTRPVQPKKISTIRAQSETSVYLEWDKNASAETFDIEYATEKRYFDNSSNTTTVTNVESNKYEVTGLETGDEYFFRVRAINSAGESPWSEITSVVLGSKPAAPTTWSSTTTAITGEPLNLYWVHNAEDGSKSTYVDLEIYIDVDMDGPTDQFKLSYTLPVDKDYENSVIKYTAPKDVDENDEEQTGYCEFNTSTYPEGVQIQWRARTAGVTKEFGDWSVQRTIDVHARPTLDFSITDSSGATLETIDSFPFYAMGIAGPVTQTPIGYSLTIMSTEAYETVDNIGNVKMVKAGEIVYSKYFDITDSLLVEFTPGNIDLENNITYKAVCVVSMNSGITAESSDEFTVAWSEMTYVPNVEISYDPSTYVTHLRPYCEITELTNYKVEHNLETDEYVVTDEILGNMYTEPGIVGTTISGEEVYLGTSTEGIETYFCTIEHNTLVEDITLSVYRREFDGSFTELGTGLSNLANTHITDPHPALDYARYRIVAVTNSTGAVCYYDPPGYPIGEKAAIIQWDEEWSIFDTQGLDDPLDQPAWTGSLLRLPYNIDVSDSNTSDVTLVEYVGRKRPVAYYGTQLGETQDWSVTIPKDDEETLYALRRLAIWMGDVYVREPSGTGFWANVSVSFSQKHLDMTIPVSIKITRVEGGA